MRGEHHQLEPVAGNLVDAIFSNSDTVTRAMGRGGHACFRLYGSERKVCSKSNKRLFLALRAFVYLHLRHNPLIFR
jgi:hypothetical protein